MIGHASLRPPLANPVSSLPRPTVRPWQRRAVEAGVSVLAFAVWGKLAYIGGYRLLARMEGLPLGGHVLLDVMSLLIGVSGSIAGVSALWALAMRATGRTPSSLIGAPDDNAIDAAYRDGTLDLSTLAATSADAYGTASRPSSRPDA